MDVDAPGAPMNSEAATHGLAVTTRALVVIYRSEGHDVAALSGVDLAVEPGEVVALLGPSGAGKSTLMSVFAGLITPSAGSATVGGRDLKKMTLAELDDFRAREVGLVLQGASRNLIPYLTPRGNVEFAQKPARRRGATVPTVDDVLETFGISELADRELSGLAPGKLQLVALSVAFAARPGLLLADEPTSQLDHESRDRVIEALKQVSRDMGTTVILVTHDPAVTAQIPRTVTIRDGRVGAEGRAGEEFVVVSADGSLPLPDDVLETFGPGSLVKVHREGDRFVLLAPDDEYEEPQPDQHGQHDQHGAAADSGESGESGT